MSVFRFRVSWLLLSAMSIVLLAVVNGDGSAMEDACFDSCAPEATCDDSGPGPICVCPTGFHDRFEDGTVCLECDFEAAITATSGRIQQAPYGQESDLICTYWDFQLSCGSGTVDVWFPIFDVETSANDVVTVGKDASLDGTDGLQYTQQQPLILSPPFFVSFTQQSSGGSWDGFQMEFMCTPADRCSASNCAPEASCTNDQDGRGYTCKCGKGYYDANGDGTVCEDIDECDVIGSGSYSGSWSGSGSAGGSGGAANNCAIEAVCTNTLGSFECSCENGYEDVSGGLGTTCQDVDECSDPGANNCDDNALCVNKDGTFECMCSPGFIDINSDGTLCKDIDDCASNATNDCADTATCTNTPGGYECACNDGYQGDGNTCAEMDECSSGAHNCDEDATCTNEEPGFSCECNQGFKGNGRSCTEDNTAVFTASLVMVGLSCDVVNSFENALKVSLASVMPGVSPSDIKILQCTDLGATNSRRLLQATGAEVDIEVSGFENPTEAAEISEVFEASTVQLQQALLATEAFSGLQSLSVETRVPGREAPPPEESSGGNGIALGVGLGGGVAVLVLILGLVGANYARKHQAPDAKVHPEPEDEEAPSEKQELPAMIEHNGRLRKMAWGAVPGSEASRPAQLGSAVLGPH